MDLLKFRDRVKSYKLAKGQNPLLNYWEWKRYAEGTEGVTDYKLQILKDVEMLNLLYDINHTDPNTGEKNPFYNRLTDDYGTVELPEVSVTAPITWKGVNALKAKRGRQAYYKGAETAFKVAAPLVAGAGLASMAGAGLLSTVINPVDAAFIATDPTLPLNYLPFVGLGAKYLGESANYINKTYKNLNRRIDNFATAGERINNLNKSYTKNIDVIKKAYITKYDDSFKLYVTEVDSRLLDYIDSHPEYILHPLRETLEGLSKNWKNLLNSQKINVDLNADDLKGLTLELTDILNTIVKEDPGYIEYAKSKNLPLLELSTLDRWIDKLRTGIRGVYTEKENAQLSDLEDMFTRTRKENTGGDRLQSGGGIYTSNSLEVSDRFSRSFHNKGGTAAQAKVLAADIDRSKPFVDLLRLLRRRIYPYDLNDPIIHAYYHELLHNDGYIGIQALYTTRNGNILPAYETAYLSDKPGEKLLDVKEFNTSNDVTNLRGRWGANAGGASTTDDLFSPRYFGESFGDFMHNVRTLKKIKPKLFADKLFDPLKRATLEVLLSKELTPKHLNEINILKELLLAALKERRDKLSSIKNKYYDNKAKLQKTKKIGAATAVGTGLIGGVAYLATNPSESVKKKIEKSKLKKTIKNNQNE